MQVKRTGGSFPAADRAPAALRMSAVDPFLPSSGQSGRPVPKTLKGAEVLRMWSLRRGFGLFSLAAGAGLWQRQRDPTTARSPIRNRWFPSPSQRPGQCRWTISISRGTSLVPLGRLTVNKSHSRLTLPVASISGRSTIQGAGRSSSPQSDDRQYNAVWSPDGKWIVYEQDHAARMVEGAHDPCLLLEAPKVILVGRQLLGDDLDGDVAAQAYVASPVDLTHAPNTDGSENLIGAEARCERAMGPSSVT